MQRLPDGRGGDAVKTKLGGNNGTTSLPQSSPKKQDPEWQHVGDVALDIVDQLARARQRVEANERIAERIIDLRARLWRNELYLLEGDFRTGKRKFENEIGRLARLIAVMKDQRL